MVCVGQGIYGKTRLVGKLLPSPLALWAWYNNVRGHRVRPRAVQAVVVEPRIPRIYPWGVSSRFDEKREKTSNFFAEWIDNNY